MLKKNIKWPDHRRYVSFTEWEPASFFSDCLCNSTSFDIMLGFFSSSAINVLSGGFSVFLFNGGKMRLIINNILSKEDKDVIIKANDGCCSSIFDLNDISALKQTLSKRDEHFFNCLAWLISEDRIEIKIVEPKSGRGMAHTKNGMFSDGKNKVSFNGSCNFTMTALLENRESIDINCSWDSNTSINKIEYIETEFNRVFSGNDDTLSYLNPEDIKAGIVESFGGKSLGELLENEEKLLESNNSPRQSLIESINAAKEKIKALATKDNKPRFPFDKPRDYQVEAFERWKTTQKGLFAMATGTGKTITSLNCLLEVYKNFGYYKALILVPTITLVEQWEEECRKFNFNNIIKVFSGNRNWKNDVSSILLFEKNNFKEANYIVISTYASYAKNNIFYELNSLPKRALLIADECHNLGSPNLINKLDRVNQDRRIGLSATPERQYDTEGNKKINKFFDSEEAYTFEYSMQDAIENGVLTKYYYYPHVISLTREEMDEYERLSAQIAKYFNPDTNTFKKDERLTMLLLARKRIIHKAANKLSKFKEILEKEFKERQSLKYTLVYVPEGNEPDDLFESDRYEKSDKDNKENDSDKLIDLYTEAVINLDSRTTVKKFVSGIKNRDEVLQDFAEGRLDVLTSMKCLDEGVDVPRAELAIFCSSTGNPRQFIQRRGRILRTHPNKDFAKIYDLVVVPDRSMNKDTYNLEKSLLRSELRRVSNFANLAINSTDSLVELYDIMNYYNLNLYSDEE